VHKMCNTSYFIHYTAGTAAYKCTVVVLLQLI
jgi:hypothetical protein